MTLGLKEWIAKVTTRILVTNGFDKVESYGVTAGNSVSITMERGNRGFLIISGASTSKGFLIVNNTSGGAVTTRWVDQGSTNLVISTSTDTVKLTNNTSYGIRVLYVEY